jgi:hypothetical protein
MRSSSALLRPSAEIADRGYPRRSGARGKCFPAPRCSAPPRRSRTKAIRGEAERAETMPSSSALLRPSAEIVDKGHPRRSGARGKCVPAPRCSAPPRMVSVALPTGGCTNPGDPGNDLSAEKRSVRKKCFPAPRCSAPPRMVSVASHLRGWCLSLRGLGGCTNPANRGRRRICAESERAEKTLRLRAAPPLRGWSLSLRRLAVVPIQEIRATTYPRRSGVRGTVPFSSRCSAPPRMVSVASHLRGWCLSLRGLGGCTNRDDTA